jgi:hypothetical protein
MAGLLTGGVEELTGMGMSVGAEPTGGAGHGHGRGARWQRRTGGIGLTGGWAHAGGGGSGPSA